jgi:hypothetical protein
VSSGLIWTSRMPASVLASGMWKRAPSGSWRRRWAMRMSHSSLTLTPEVPRVVMIARRPR